LWKFALPSSKVINLRINSSPWEFKEWDKLFSREITVASSFNEGFAILEFQQRLILETIKEKVHRVQLIKGESVYSLWAVQCSTPQLISEIGNTLVDVLPDKKVCIYSFDGRQWYFSFRSKDEVDVGAMAQILGGGGHRNASGVYWKHLQIKPTWEGLEFTWIS
jgi:oligoribonuclease NrnB/cAMP/cGMP phosphodiesterase (DHH superfamily)